MALSEANILYARTLTQAIRRGIKIVYKDTWFWKMLNVLTIIVTFGRNNTFLLSITTVGKTVAVPRYWDTWTPEYKAAVLVHELVHVEQAEKYTLLGFWFLYFLFPLPIGLAWFRYKFERDAYLAELKLLKDPEARREQVEFVVDEIAGAGYVWAWPFKKAARRWFEANL